MGDDASVDYPQGIAPEHVDHPRRRHANPLSLLVLGVVMALALAGVFGGGRSPTRVAQTPAARLAVHTPTIIRNGQFFETRIFITARRPIGKVVLAVTPSAWRDLTQNSMIPAAEKESFEDGRFRYEFGALKAGDTLEIKADFQINPALFGGVAGEIAVLDDKAELVRLPVAIKVRP